MQRVACNMYRTISEHAAMHCEACSVLHAMRKSACDKRTLSTRSAPLQPSDVSLVSAMAARLNAVEESANRLRREVDAKDAAIKSLRDELDLLRRRTAAAEAAVRTAGPAAAGALGCGDAARRHRSGRRSSASALAGCASP
jgi:hypothetical protein